MKVGVEKRGIKQINRIIPTDVEIVEILIFISLESFLIPFSNVNKLLITPKPMKIPDGAIKTPRKKNNIPCNPEPRIVILAKTPKNRPKIEKSITTTKRINRKFCRKEDWSCVSFWDSRITSSLFILNINARIIRRG